MKKRVIPGLVLILCFTAQTSAQENEIRDYKNAVKVNSVALIFNNVSLLYERKLNSHWTLQGGTSFRWGGGVPKVLGLGNLIVSSRTHGVRGFSFTPEVRYYFNFCECGGSPSGLYAGFYSRYTRYYGDLAFHYWTGTEYIDVVSSSYLREFGAGIQIGYQFIFKERFLVDFMFAGPRLSSERVKFSIESDYLDELVPAIEEEINRRLDWLGMDPINLDPSTEMKANFGFRNFRYCIGIGILL